MYFIIKTVVTAVIIAGVSELAKRHSFLAAALLSLPITSLLSFIWIYYETKDTEKIVELSHSTLGLIIPSLLFFILLPFFLKLGVKFYPSVLLSCLIMSGGYGIFLMVKKLFS